MIYFDNAATTFPKPRRVIASVMQAMERYGANPGRSGHKLSLDAAIKVYETRERAAAFFNAGQAEDVVFTSNCTHALNFALKGALRQGDHVIISDLEHNSVLRPVHALAQKGVVTYDIAEICEDDDEVTLQNFAGLLKPNTRLIAVTNGSNVWGIGVPIEAIGAFAKSNDVLFLVDAAQTAGVVPIDMRQCGIDFLCTAGHKSLYGPAGTGLLITPAGSLLEPVFTGGTGTLSADFAQPADMPERLESGTVNTCGIIGLGAGIDHVREKGLDSIYGQTMRIALRIYEGLGNMDGIRLYTKSFGIGSHLPVVSFNVDGMTSEDVTAALSDLGFAVRGGLHCAPLAHKKMRTLETGAVRISVGSFNTRQQADQLLRAVARVRNQA